MKYFIDLTIYCIMLALVDTIAFAIFFTEGELGAAGALGTNAILLFIAALHFHMKYLETKD